MKCLTPKKTKKDEVMRVALIWHDWCLFKKILGHRHIQRDHVKIQGEDSHLQGEGGASGETNPAGTLSSDF